MLLPVPFLRVNHWLSFKLELEPLAALWQGMK